MAVKKTRILLRSDIKANWELANPVLLKGEVGIEYNPTVSGEDRVIKFKIGDGVKTWNQLGYVADYDSVINALGGRVTLLEGAIADVYTKTEVNNLLNDKVDKVEGSRLMTSAEGTKLEGIEAGAEVNVLEGIILNGVEQTITNKKIDLGSIATSAAIDTLNTKIDNEISRAQGAESGLGSRLEAVENDLDDVYTKSEVYTKTEADTAIAAAIAGIKHWSYQVVDQLPQPSADCEHIIYLVPKTSGVGYKEWICIGHTEVDQETGADVVIYDFEEIGDTDIDLSNYYNKTEVDGFISNLNTAIGGKVDQSAYNTKVGELETAISGKVAQSAYDTKVAKIEGDIDDLELASHSHSNKAELDLIQTGDVAKWNAKQDAISVDEGLTFSSNQIGLNLESIILDCGDASDWAPAANEDPENE